MRSVWGCVCVFSLSAVGSMAVIVVSVCNAIEGKWKGPTCLSCATCKCLFLRLHAIRIQFTQFVVRNKMLMGVIAMHSRQQFRKIQWNALKDVIKPRAEHKLLGLSTAREEWNHRNKQKIDSNRNESNAKCKKSGWAGWHCCVATIVVTVYLLLYGQSLFCLLLQHAPHIGRVTNIHSISPITHTI